MKKKKKQHFKLNQEFQLEITEHKELYAYAKLVETAKDDDLIDF